MENLFKSKFVSIDYSKEKELLSAKWTGNDEDLDDATLKSLFLKFADFIKFYKPQLIITDEVDRKIPYSIELQNWIANTTANAAISIGLKRFAIVLPKEFIAELSTEQTVEELPTIPFELKFFQSIEEAYSWLFS